MNRPLTPSKAETDLLPPFDGLPLERIFVPNSSSKFAAAAEEIRAAGVVGFDTESKPTFLKAEVSEGPHIVQFALPDKAFIFQLHHGGCHALLIELLRSPALLKVGFGLESDQGQIQQKLGTRLGAVLDLNRLFRQDGYATSTGVRAAVGIVFQQKFQKSKKVTTSNWAVQQLTARQLLYAANDAYAALRVLMAMNRPQAELPIAGMTTPIDRADKADLAHHTQG